jgi:TonB-dependent receptor
MSVMNLAQATWRAALICGILCATGTIGSAQTSATVTGIVRDAQGGVLPGATVRAVYQPTGASSHAVTRTDGTYALTGLRTGAYRISASMPGFRDADPRDIAFEGGEEKRVDFQLQIAPMSEELTVRAGTALARDEKRSSANIVDVVSADAMGRFPDANAAEALRRIPGVSLEIDQGEGRFVVIRGVDASLNNVTLNGQIVGTPAEFGTRGVSMDSVPADLISRLEVVKAVTPDMDGNAIGANVNIKTLGAFDRPNGLLSGTFRTGYNDLSGRAPFSGNATYGRTFGSERRVGIVLGGSFSNRRFDSDLFRASNGTWSQFNGYFVPQNQAYLLYDVQRRRSGVNAAVSYRAKAGHDLTLRANRNLFRDIEGRQQTELDLTRGTLSNQTPTSGQFSQGRATREFRDYEQHHTIDALMTSGQHAARFGLVDWQAGFSRGERDTPRRVDWEFRSAANAFPSRYDTSDPERSIVTPTDNFYNPASYPFRRVRFRTDLEREDVVTAQLNWRHERTLAGMRGAWKTGAKIVARDKTQNRDNQNYTGSTFTLADFDLGGPEPGRFFDGRSRFGPTINLAAVQRFFASNPDRFTFDPLATRSDSLVQDFDAQEHVTAAYAMRTLEFDGWNLLAGVRVEHTEGDYHANELLLSNGTFTGNIRPAVGETSYTDVLPGVHVTITPRRNLVIRGAWTNTIGRPAYASLAPIKALDDIQVEPGVFIGSLSLGNPALKPYRSMNLDGSLEYYLGSGLVAIAPFYKRIDDPIFGRSFVERGTTYEDRFYEQLGVAQPENADSGHIGGVELTYQNYFTRLPAPFDGLGVNLNYTVTDSAVRIFDRDDRLPFFKQSNHVGNIAVLYEKFGVAGQVSLSFNSPSLGSIGTNRDTDNYGDTYRVVDVKVSAPLARGLRGMVEIGNLNDEHRLRYAGTPDRRVQDEVYSWNLFVGIDWRLR